MPPPPATKQVKALGTLEPKGGVIDVGGTVGERLESYKVEAGQTVKQGEPLAILESHHVREIQLQAAELALQEAKRRQAVEQSYGDSLVADAKLGIESLDLDRLDLAVQQSKIKLLEANLGACQERSRDGCKSSTTRSSLRRSAIIRTCWSSRPGPNFTVPRPC